jgi:hypothetical protein
LDQYVERPEVKLEITRRLYVILLITVISIPGFSPVKASSNRLTDHPSPYLKLHANDPVHWRTWGPEVLQQAARDNRLVYLSIGYFSCHWCHVMQRESFKDKQVAADLNRHYIPVKVDRELHPELDRRMIAFVEEVRGTAGWPLNVFLTPEGYPVTGFTYVPRDSFHQALGELQAQWQARHGVIGPAAQEYFTRTESSISQADLVSLPDENFSQVVEAFISQAMGIADELQGGFGDTSKFPSVPQMMALIKAIELNPDIDPDVHAFVRLTLTSMAQRNLRDHVNGGFFRYTTDPDWQTPHFEKMLYDNVQLVRLYLAAHRLWPQLGYADVAMDTLEFVERDLGDPAGGYFSSLSAVDRDNVEGAAYLWTRDEVKQLLAEETLAQLEQAGLLLASGQATQIANLQGLGEALAKDVRRRLRQAPRAVMPVDTKKLAGWNALALLALLEAEQLTDDRSLRQKVDRQYEFILRNFVRGRRVTRFTSGDAVSETTLQDQALVARAFAAYAGLQREAAVQRDARLQALWLIEGAYQLYFGDDLWKRSLDAMIPGEKGSWVIQDGVLESPVSGLLEAELILDGLKPEQVSRRHQLIKRLTRDMLDLPYHYASAIMLRQNYLSRRDNTAKAVGSQ